MEASTLFRLGTEHCTSVKGTLALWKALKLIWVSLLGLRPNSTLGSHWADACVLMPATHGQRCESAAGRCLACLAGSLWVSFCRGPYLSFSGVLQTEDSCEDSAS